MKINKLEKYSLPKKLRVELRKQTNVLLAAFANESFLDKITEIEDEFLNRVISLSQVSRAYKSLAGSYMILYEHVRSEKKKEEINGRNN